MDFEDLLEEIILYCLEIKDQELWDILYPYLKAQGFMCHRDIYKTQELLKHIDEN